MKKIIFLITTLYLVNFINFANADSNIPLKKYLEKKDIEKGPAQVYLLNRCSAVYAYASAIIFPRSLSLLQLILLTSLSMSPFTSIAFSVK